MYYRPDEIRLKCWNLWNLIFRESTSGVNLWQCPAPHLTPQNPKIQSWESAVSNLRNHLSGSFHLLVQSWAWARARALRLVPSHSIAISLSPLIMEWWFTAVAFGKAFCTFSLLLYFHAENNFYFQIITNPKISPALFISGASGALSSSSDADTKHAEAKSLMIWLAMPSSLPRDGEVKKVRSLASSAVERKSKKESEERRS